MSFNLSQTTGESAELDLQYTEQSGSEREAKVLATLTTAIKDLTREVGGYLAVSATGHINDADGLPGDTLNVQITSILRPSDPTPDTGSEAALSSTAANPPEAVTAAPQTSEGSPPADQQPLPPALGASVPEGPGQPDPSIAATELLADQVVSGTPPAAAPAADGSDVSEPSTSSPAPTDTTVDQSAAQDPSTTVPDDAMPVASDPVQSAEPTADMAVPGVALAPEQSAQDPISVAATDLTSGTPSVDPSVAPATDVSASPETVSRALYIAAPGTTVDESVWPLSGLQTPDGQPLYFYTGDTTPGQTSGSGLDGVWTLYDGPNQPVAA